MDLNQEENQYVKLKNSKVKNDIELKWIMACFSKMLIGNQCKKIQESSLPNVLTKVLKKY